MYLPCFSCFAQSLQFSLQPVQPSNLYIQNVHMLPTHSMHLLHLPLPLPTNLSPSVSLIYQPTYLSQMQILYNNPPLQSSPLCLKLPQLASLAPLIPTHLSSSLPSSLPTYRPTRARCRFCIKIHSPAFAALSKANSACFSFSSSPPSSLPLPPSLSSSASSFPTGHST